MSNAKYQHVRWVDLVGNGIAKEVLVLSEDTSNGDICFIPVDHLDDIDRARVVSMLRSRDAATLPLWEVMANTTLKNGQNALLCFHQLVKVRTMAGQILPPGKGRGAHNIPQQTLTETLAEAGVQIAAEPAKRGPGRPPRADG